MVDELVDFLDLIDRAADEINELYWRIPKRYIRDCTNPFEYFPEDVFFKRFKFSKEEVMYFIVPIIKEDLEKHNNRGLPIQPVLQLLMALRFYATSSYQAVIGDLNDFSLASVCLCIRRVSVVLAGNMHNYVHIPRTIEKERQNIKKFYAIAGFPHAAACIDGTLIKIASPGKAEIFRSRKGFFSLNVMGVTGPRGEFLFLDVRHPGSVHDQTSSDRIALKMMLIENRITGLLVGDNGYGCQPYLLTPVLNPLNEAERNYNRRHIKTRNTIERAFGRWKRKFPV